MEVLIMAASAPTCMMSNVVPHLLPMVNGGTVHGWILDPGQFSLF